MSRLGYKRVGGSQRHVGAILALALFAVIMVLSTSAGGALPTPTLFELDGNATTGAHVGTPDDWDRIYCAQTGISCSPSPGTPAAFSSSFIGANVENPSVDITYFKGGAKDGDATPPGCGGNAAPKDEINNAYSAAYVDPDSGDTMLYFGGDRATPNGDSDMGVWLDTPGTAQSPGLGTSTTPCSVGFTGSHQNGDLLVLSTFTNGGGVSTVQIYQWQNGSLNTTPIASGASCATTADLTKAPFACAIANSADISVPWPPTSGTTGGTIASPDFFEGGVDLTELFASLVPAQPLPCFSSFYEETRSSQSLTATLMDFAFGTLNTCGSIELQKTWSGGGTGSTTLKIGSTPGGNEVAPGTTVASPNDGTTGAHDSPPGTYYVNESTIPNFTSSLACVNNKGGTSQSVSVGANNSVPLTTGDQIVCTFTNTYLKASPTISTTASGPVTLGSAIHDVATLTGTRGTPDKSTVTFNVYAASDPTCSTPLNASPIAASSNTAAPNPTYTSADYTPAHAGTYKWIASFTGDADNNAIAGLCNAANESSVVNPKTPTISTQASGPVSVGSAIHDVATLTGPSGVPDKSLVTFNVYASTDATCATPLNASPIASVSNTTGANPTYTSGDFTPAHSGTYKWIASFAGDTDNHSVAGACNAANESSVVNPAVPTISTQASGPVQVGSSIHDVATLTGPFGVPDKSLVTFNVYASSDSTCTTPLNASPIAAASNTTGANPTYTSGDFTPAHAGTYKWIASFAGNADNNAVAGVCNAANESSLVNPASPTISTNASGPVTVGSSIHDVATLTGPFGVPDKSLVTFNVYASSDSTCTTPLNASPIAAASNTTGANPTYTSGDFTPAHAGTYKWIASFAGNADNNAVAGVCNAANESSLVNPASPTISTNASGPVTVGSSIHDVATLTGPFGVPDKSLVTFNVYASSDSTCTTPLNASPIAAASNTTGANPTYTSGDFTPAHAGTYKWIASFAGNADNNAVAGVCNAANESSLVNPASPTISTNASGPVTVGSSIHDVATLTGPFGVPDKSLVTFNVYASSDSTCTTPLNASPIAAASNTTGANPTYTSGDFTPAHSGTYKWIASFAGNADNHSVSGVCNAVNESSVVNPAAPTISTQASGPVQVGSPVHDVATLTGPFGVPDKSKVTFNIYDATADPTCTTPLNASPIASVSNTTGANPTYTSADYTPANTGSYKWIATFAGDSDNSAVAGKCSDANETSVVVKVLPITTTTLHNAADDSIVANNTALQLGSGLYDVAHVTSSDGLPLTGTVTFQFFDNGSCTGPASPSDIETGISLVSGNATSSKTKHLNLPAGGYSFAAQYVAGTDTNHNDSALSDCEPFSINLATPTLTTTVKDSKGNVVANAAPAALGTATHDTATLGGKVDSLALGDGTANAPNGATVTYEFFPTNDCSSETHTDQVVPVGADGSVPDANPQTLGAGSYSYLAVYSGNSNYAPKTAACEPFHITQATPTLSTKVKDGTGTEVTNAAPAALGTAIHDTATLGASAGAFPLGGATDPATVTYEFFNNNACTGGTHTDQVVSVDAAGVVPDADPQTLAAGSYSYLAVYSGNSNYTTQAAACEPFKVNQATPTLSTKVKDDTGTEVTNAAPAALGTAIHDTATLGASVGAFPLGGATDPATVTYEFFNSNSCNSETHTNEVVNVSAAGVVPDASPQTLAAGSYSYLAVYSGNSNYAAQTAACEPFKVSQATPTLVTTVKDANGGTVTNAAPAPLGSAVHDTAILGSSVGTFPLGGAADPATVKYEFFSSNDCSGSHTDLTVTVAASGSVPDANPQTLGAGSYSYLAIYGGNSNYTTQTAACEPFSVTKVTPAATTTLHNAANSAVVPNGTALDNGSGLFDVATVTATDSFPLSGTVTFQFFTNATCSGSPSSTQTGVALSSGTATSSSHLSLAPGSYAFNAQYIAGSDTNHNNSAVSGCEPFSINSPPPPGGTPSIGITKNPEKGQTITSGGTAIWTIVVTNTGTLPLSNVSVSDPLAPNCNQSGSTIPALVSNWAPGASVTYNCSLGNVTANFTNVATATGTGSNGQTVTANDSAPVTVTVPPAVIPQPPASKPAIDIVKDPKTQSLAIGGTATFKITVTNTGDVTLTDVTVTDQPSPDCNRKVGTLAVGQSKSYTCTKTNVQADFQNVATASGKPPTGARVKATDHATINVAAFVPPENPAISIQKNPNHQTVTTNLKTIHTKSGATNTTVKYGTATFTITVKNIGKSALHSVKVADALSPNCNRSIGNLGIGKSRTYSCTKPTVTRGFTNTAVASGLSPKGTKVTAKDSAKVGVKVKTTSTAPAKFTG